MFLVAAAWGGWTAAAQAVPTEFREWRSTAGTTIEAQAVAVEGTSVKMKTRDGRELEVPLGRLLEADRDFLTEHFKLGDRILPGAEPMVLPYPVGETSGPHKAGDGSSYFIYLPKSLKPGRKAPLLLFTGSGGGRANHVDRHRNGSELNGWIVAASVQSRNKVDTNINHGHAKRCVEHILATLPVDPQRLYFTGGSGGGAMAFNNSVRLQAAGAMPFIGYNKFGDPPAHAHYYVLGGAMDFNRYLSADAAASVGNRGFHRMYPGAHADPPSWIVEEAMTWLNGRYLAANQSDRALADQAMDWESAMIQWIISLKDDAPYRGHYWCRFLEKDYRIAGQNAAQVAAMSAAFSKDPINVKYSDALDAINAFSRKHYTGVTTGSSFGHNTPEMERAAMDLLKVYEGVPHVEDVIREIGQKTRR